MKKTLAFLFIAASVFSLNSCSKEGPQGPAGKDGNANVKSILLNASSFAWDNSNLWRYDSWSGISILTSEVSNSGAVMLYENNGLGGWTAVPYSFNAGGGVTAHVFYDYAPGTVGVYVALSDDSDPGSFTDQFKLVCIPPAARKAHPDLDLKNYEEVKKAFHLTE